jgi:biopolymer transport protein ExbD
MSRKVSLTSMKQISEINLTPLMDLTFILLITFIITFPMIEQGIIVKLPKGETDKISDIEATSVTIDKDGILYLDNIRVTYEDLVVSLMELGKMNADASVMVRADERIRYGEVIKVLKVLHDAKIVKMALVTEAEE